MEDDVGDDSRCARLLIEARVIWEVLSQRFRAEGLRHAVDGVTVGVRPDHLKRLTAQGARGEECLRRVRMRVRSLDLTEAAEDVAYALLGADSLLQDGLTEDVDEEFRLGPLPGICFGRLSHGEVLSSAHLHIGFHTFSHVWEMRKHFCEDDTALKAA